MANSYTQGRLVQVTGTFFNPNSTVPPTDPVSGFTLVDPTSVFLDVVTPDGVVHNYQYGVGGTIVRSSQGIYTAQIDTTPLPGQYKYYWYSTGTGQTAGELSFYVIGAP